jgi:hypothetical protein
VLSAIPSPATASGYGRQLLSLPRCRLLLRRWRWRLRRSLPLLLVWLLALLLLLEPPRLPPLMR